MLYHFEGFILDLQRGCLTREGNEIALRPQPFRLLTMFLESPGRVISKDEIIDAVWPSTTVTDDSLTQCIKDLRKAIRDDRRTIIRTLPRRGYLLACPVERSDRAARMPPDHPLAPLRLGIETPTIAVLPLDNVSGDTSQDYLGRGIAEDIIIELSRMPELSVISRNSSFRFAAAQADLQEIGRDLGVRYVLDGSIRRRGKRIRITVQLTDVESRTSRWAERYDCSVDELADVQDNVIGMIASFLAAHLNQSEVERTARKSAASWKAYDYYLQGADTYAGFHREMTAENIHRARAMIEQSIALDPKYAPAYVVLSAICTSSYNLPLDRGYLRPGTLADAHEAAKTAIKLDPKSPRTYAQLGYVMIFLRQPDSAVSLFERAIALNPNFSDWRLILALLMAGDKVRAVEVARWHIRLDPFFLPIAKGYLGLAHYMLKDYDTALPILQEFVALAPNHQPGRLWLASTYAQLGRRGEACEQAAELLRINPSWTLEQFEPLGPFKEPEDAFHFLDGMRKAGLPER